MNNVAKELLRCTAIAVAGALLVWVLVDIVRFFLNPNVRWIEVVWTLPLFSLVALPLLAIIRFCYRREYRKLYLVVGAVGSLVIFALLIILPVEVGLYEHLAHLAQRNPAFGFLFLPASLLFLFGPAYAAGAFFSICQSSAHRDPGKRWARTRATRGLVWPGILLVLSPVIGATVAANFWLAGALLGGKPPPPLDPETSHAWFVGAGGSILAGSLLIFLGVVRRKPIKDGIQSDEPDSAE